MTTTEGYVIPIQIRRDLPYIDMTPPSDEDLEEYPHVGFTSDMPWDPSILDDEYLPEEVQSLQIDNYHSYNTNTRRYIEAYKAFTQPKCLDRSNIAPKFGYAPQ
jgi:hypothetical protein